MRPIVSVCGLVEVGVGCWIGDVVVGMVRLMGLIGSLDRGRDQIFGGV
jgi:hypothetical protein